MKCMLRNKQPNFMKVVKLNGEVIGTMHAFTDVDRGFALSYSAIEEKENRYNPFEYGDAEIYRSLIGHGAGWNLTDEAGQPLPLTMDNISLLPADIKQAFRKAFEELNTVTEEHLGNSKKQSD